MEKFKFLDIATADIAFEAYGKSLNELFENSALATFEVMSDTKKIKQKIKRTFSVGGNSVENLLFDFLSELIYLKDADKVVFSKFMVKVNGKGNSWKASASAHGDNIKSAKQNLKLDVKAVTLHMFKIEKTKNGYKAFVLLDI